MLEVISDLKMVNVKIEKDQDINTEREFEVLFHKRFKQYLVAQRDNVVFVYPDNINTEHFPCFILKYRQYDGLEKIYESFRNVFPQLSKYFIKIRDLFL